MVTVLDALRSRAAAQPSRVALVSDRGADATPERVTFGQLIEEMDRIASVLREAGVSRGERCGLVARQGTGFIRHALGILASGACLAPLADEPGTPGFDAARREAVLHHVVCVSGADAERMEVMPGSGDSLAQEAEFRALDPCYLRFTSGTTNRRKGVVLGHAAVQARLDAANAALGIDGRDAILWLLPMAHHFVVSILLYLREGATILLPASMLARPMLRFATSEGATILYASPFHHRLLAGDAGTEPLPRLRLAISTAEALRADLAEAFARRFGRPLVQALGVIECGLPFLNLAAAVRKPEAIGRPLPGYEVWLRDEAGRRIDACGPEHAGELCIRGPGLFDAYLAPWTPASAVLEPDGFRTGDQAFCDDEGDFHLVGRRTNRINVAGMKFFCEEVEAVLDSHPLVLQSRVEGRVHAQLGEIPVASVVPRDSRQPPGPDVLRAFCRQWLPAYKAPREIRVVDALPTTDTGKLLRWRAEEGR